MSPLLDSFPRHSSVSLTPIPLLHQLQKLAWSNDRKGCHATFEYVNLHLANPKPHFHCSDLRLSALLVDHNISNSYVPVLSFISSTFVLADTSGSSSSPSWRAHGSDLPDSQSARAELELHGPPANPVIYSLTSRTLHAIIL